jgi:hypothetical protein
MPNDNTARTREDLKKVWEWFKRFASVVSDRSASLATSVKSTVGAALGTAKGSAQKHSLTQAFLALAFGLATVLVFFQFSPVKESAETRVDVYEHALGAGVPFSVPTGKTANDVVVVVSAEQLDKPTGVELVLLNTESQTSVAKRVVVAKGQSVRWSVRGKYEKFRAELDADAAKDAKVRVIVILAP